MLRPAIVRVLWAVLSILLVVPLASATAGAATLHRDDAPTADLVSAESSPSPEDSTYRRALGWDGDDHLVSVVASETPARLTGGASHVYDTPAVSRFGVGAPGSSESVFPQVKAGGGGAALPATRVEGASMTPVVSFVTPSGAIDDGVRLRPGTAQPGVPRTYQTALNPQGYIDDVVDAYGINLRGSGQQITAVYNPNLVSAGRVRASSPNVIEIGPLGMSSSDELARTLAHEMNHARSFLRGGSAPEVTAYRAEDMLSAWLRGDI